MANVTEPENKCCREIDVYTVYGDRGIHFTFVIAAKNNVRDIKLSDVVC